MKILVVGLGSMGKRRMRLLPMAADGIILSGVDARADRRAEAAELFGARCFESIAEAVAAAKPDAALVCTAPLAHAAIIRELLEAGISVFTEINLVKQGYTENTALAKEKNLTLFLSSTQLYRRELMAVEEEVAGFGKPVHWRYHVGQYLPDWHPWESFHDFFLGDRRTNGIREILAIELPWIERAFSPIREIRSEASRLTDLSIDYPDVRMMTVLHENGTVGQFCADLVCRSPVRSLEVFGDGLQLSWSGTADSLKRYDTASRSFLPISTYESVEQDPRYQASIVENAYVDELRAFFGALRGEDVRRRTFEEDARTLTLIDRLEGVE